MKEQGNLHRRLIAAHIASVTPQNHEDQLGLWRGIGWALIPSLIGWLVIFGVLGWTIPLLLSLLFGGAR